ncbi:MAG: ABC transporter ATP-binding protein [Gammaproteobacteria bacterium]|nr:ABC transporter ATP-binding protein [Gammaproteobacteria bacterium]
MNTAAEPVIRIENARKRYGARTVLDGATLEVAAGECFGLVGINGAGKTTLIKCLLDFARADTGTLSLFGRSSLDAVSRAQLAFLPERFVPPYYLTGADFLDYMAQLHGAVQETTQLPSLLAAVDLEAAALAQPVRQLSKGMAQKLGLLACFASGKPLLVLDEPMSGLDPKARAAVMQHLRRLRDAGRTVFFSTHLLHDVEVLCDRLAILHGGRVAFTGSPIRCCDQFSVPDLETAYLRCVGGQASAG